MSKDHILPDPKAERYNWEFVKHIAAKARAEAFKEAAELADLYALIDNTTVHSKYIPGESYTQELRRLPAQASSGALPPNKSSC